MLQEENERNAGSPGCLVVQNVFSQEATARPSRAHEALLHGSAIETEKAFKRFQQDTFSVSAAQLVRARNNPEIIRISKRYRPFWAQNALPAQRTTLISLRIVHAIIPHPQGCSTLFGRLYWVRSATHARRCLTSDRKGDTRT